LGGRAWFKEPGKERKGKGGEKRKRQFHFFTGVTRQKRKPRRYLMEGRGEEKKGDQWILSTQKKRKEISLTVCVRERGENCLLKNCGIQIENGQTGRKKLNWNVVGGRRGGDASSLE